jgi:hypothetical protein
MLPWKRHSQREQTNGAQASGWTIFENSKIEFRSFKMMGTKILDVMKSTIVQNQSEIRCTFSPQQ